MVGAWPSEDPYDASSRPWTAASPPRQTNPRRGGCELCGMLPQTQARRLSQAWSLSWRRALSACSCGCKPRRPTRAPVSAKIPKWERARRPARPGASADGCRWSARVPAASSAAGNHTEHMAICAGRYPNRRPPSQPPLHRACPPHQNAPRQAGVTAPSVAPAGAGLTDRGPSWRLRRIARRSRGRRRPGGFACGRHWALTSWNGSLLSVCPTLQRDSQVEDAGSIPVARSQ